jgi:hypothetical protein
MEMAEPTRVDEPHRVRGSSPGSPAPVGMTVRTSIECGDRYSAPIIYNLQVTLEEIMRGDAAWERVKTEGVSNEPPRPDFEYMLVRIKVECFRKARGNEGGPYRIRQGQFTAVSPDGGTEYETPSVVRQPQPQVVDVPLSPGDSHEGWVVLQVPQLEKKPLLIFKRERAESLYGIWGPLFFQLH